MEGKRTTTFACESCRGGKRKCDAQKPQCSRCQRQGKECVYVVEDKPKRRKYWDEEYIHSLENQVKTLLAALNERNEQPTASVPQKPLEAPTAPAVSTYITEDKQDTLEDRSVSAMEELSVMMWRTNIGDGVTIVNDSANTATLIGSNEHRLAHSVAIPANVSRLCQDEDLLHELGELFLDRINAEFQFTAYSSTDALLGYPHQPLSYTFLHSAMLAVGATFSDRSDAAEIGETFAQFAESLVFTCIREEPIVQVLQGLCMLSWRSLALGRDQFGWIFISMAAGLCVHLRLHVLALDECSARAWHPQDAEISTFWMFYLIDRTAISILGRKCVLPWRRVNVPDFESTADPLTISMAQLSFSWQCKLWYLHDEKMDEIFSTRFDSMPAQQQVLLLVATHDALNSFFRARDRRLDLKGLETSKHVLFFHMTFQMALLITLPPFLRCLCAPRAKTEDSEVIALSLRSLTSAASNMIRLVRMYRDSDPEQWKQANPVVIHHLLSASIVMLMNATSKSTSLRNKSTTWLRTCMELLSQLRVHWPTRADKTIRVIRVLAERWKVMGALPLQYSAKLESDTNEATVQNQCSHPNVLDPAPGASNHQLPHMFANLTSEPDAWNIPHSFDDISFISDSSWSFEPALNDFNSG